MGLLDMVALPLWIGALIQHYRFDPQQAGFLVTVFLVGAVLSSIVVAPLFHRLKTGRWIAVGGFGIAAWSFYTVAGTNDLATMAVLHAVAGASIGAALSVTSGTVARSENPHRLFALCGVALGIFALVFLGSMPPIIAKHGGPIVFLVFTAAMLVGGLASLLAFPHPDPAKPVPAGLQNGNSSNRRAIWAGIIGLCLLNTTQAMGFSFLERVGTDRGFGVEKVTLVLVILGIVNLFPTAVAAMLEKRLPARGVLMGGPVVQALLVMTIYTAVTYLPFAIAGALFVAVQLFTHVFGFGLLARMETTGRVLAATPAMMLTGAAIGPVLGGTLVKASGYPAVGIAALVIGGLSLLCFAQLPREKRLESALA
jgi:predicted MFS family arabinose efflux permease